MHTELGPAVGMQAAPVHPPRALGYRLDRRQFAYAAVVIQAQGDLQSLGAHGQAAAAPGWIAGTAFRVAPPDLFLDDGPVPVPEPRMQQQRGIIPASGARAMKI